jgi:hypothetical protein
LSWNTFKTAFSKEAFKAFVHSYCRSKFYGL